jgi:hypothetical protein
MVDGCCSARHVQPRPSGRLVCCTHCTVCCTDELGNRWRKIITLAHSLSRPLARTYHERGTRPSKPAGSHLSAALPLELLFPAPVLFVACERVRVGVGVGVYASAALDTLTLFTLTLTLTTPSTTTTTALCLESNGICSTPMARIHCQVGQPTTDGRSAQPVKRVRRLLRVPSSWRSRQTQRRPPAYAPPHGCFPSHPMRPSPCRATSLPCPRSPLLPLLLLKT